MTNPDRRRREGVRREESDTVDEAGYIVPSIGALEHALYFTTAPSVVDKTKQVLDEGRLALPGVVVVWDETVGRRKGSKAVPKSWWAATGSLTVAFVFPKSNQLSLQEKLLRAAAAVIGAAATFHPRDELVFRAPNDLLIADKKCGAVWSESHKSTDLVIVRLNCSTDFAKAPPAITAGACRLVDFLDVRELPLQQASTLSNTLLTVLMTAIPKAFATKI